MKYVALATAAAIAMSASLSGCAQITAARDFLADPKTQLAGSLLLAEAKAGATLISCFVGAGSSIALAVEQSGNTKGQYATGIVYSASSKVCSTLQGQATGSIKASGGETVVTGTAAPAQ